MDFNSEEFKRLPESVQGMLLASAIKDTKENKNEMAYNNTTSEMRELLKKTIMKIETTKKRYRNLKPTEPLTIETAHS